MDTNLKIKLVIPVDCEISYSCLGVYLNIKDKEIYYPIEELIEILSTNLNRIPTQDELMSACEVTEKDRYKEWSLIPKQLLKREMIIYNFKKDYSFFELIDTLILPFYMNDCNFLNTTNEVGNSKKEEKLNEIHPYRIFALQISEENFEYYDQEIANLQRNNLLKLQILGGGLAYQLLFLEKANKKYIGCKIIITTNLIDNKIILNEND